MRESIREIGRDVALEETREMREKGETWEGGEMGDEYPPARVYFGITFRIQTLAWRRSTART